MGMYDHFDLEAVCPYCNRIIDGFQTKSGICDLRTYKPGDKISSCDIVHQYNGQEIKLTEFVVYSDCIHEISDTDNIKLEGKHTYTINEYVWCEIHIPIINNIISEDRSKWTFSYNIVKDNMLNIVQSDKIDTKKFNNMIKMSKRNSRHEASIS